MAHCKVIQVGAESPRRQRKPIIREQKLYLFSLSLEASFVVIDFDSCAELQGAAAQRTWPLTLKAIVLDKVISFKIMGQQSSLMENRQRNSEN